MIFASSAPPARFAVRGIRVDCASNHSYLESRSCSSWTAPPFWSVGFALVFPIFAGESDNLEASNIHSQFVKQKYKISLDQEHT